MNHDKIMVIDYGSQYTQLITRRIRELNVYSEIYSYEVTKSDIQEYNPKAIILSGGPSSVYDENAFPLSEDVLKSGLPILGICYGLQLLVHNLGGKISSKDRGEYGPSKVSFKTDNDIFQGLNSESNVWMSHGDEVEFSGEKWNVLAKSENGIIAGLSHIDKPFYGVQFHPEVVHTHEGLKILSNFIFKISNCNPTWTSKNFIDDAINKIRSQVGEDKEVVSGLSGGVDSSVMATLMHKAIGSRSNCIFVDHGLLRKNEADEVMGSLKDGLQLNIIKINAKNEFLNKLKSVTDPEKKRKIIGAQFIETFEDSTKKLSDISFLAQGTLYPDVIESGGSKLGPAATIKSHHNVGGLPEDLDFKLIEPLRDLFKDEVREIGRELGLPDFVLNRHPFPGPGLAVRIIGEITENRINILQEADDIFIQTLKDKNEYDNIWQAFAVLIPIKTVGVMGDSRTYENLIGLRAVTSRDGMTADWYKMPPEILEICSNRIINEINGVNRVVYDVTSKPPGTIEWE